MGLFPKLRFNFGQAELHEHHACPSLTPPAHVIGSVNFSPGTNEKNTPIFDGRDANMVPRKINGFNTRSTPSPRPERHLFAKVCSSFSFITVNVGDGGAVWFDNASLVQPDAQVVAVPGDYNGNGVVDAADYVVWRNNVGQSDVEQSRHWHHGSGWPGRLRLLAISLRKYFGQRQRPRLRRCPRTMLLGVGDARRRFAVAKRRRVITEFELLGGSQGTEQAVMRYSNRRQQSGFTLVELLVVIAIIGILVGALAARHPSGTRSRSSRRLCK